MLDNTHYALEAFLSQNLNIPYIIFSEVYTCSSLFFLSLHCQAEGIHVVPWLQIMFSGPLNVPNR